RDRAAEKHGQLRVIDESGGDYLYPKAFFRSIALPQSIKKAVLNSMIALARWYFSNIIPPLYTKRNSYSNASRRGLQPRRSSGPARISAQNTLYLEPGA